MRLSAEERCGLIMIGSGTDTYDPTCDLAKGHDGFCKSVGAIDQHRLTIRRFKVFCTQWASCGWSGWRQGATHADVTGPYGSARACPRCRNGTAA